MIKPSSSLIDFLKQVQFVHKKLDESKFHHIPVLEQTNEYNAHHFIAVSINDKPRLQSTYKEIKEILAAQRHYRGEDIIHGLMILFSLCPENKRTEKLILTFFQLMTSVQLKQYLFFAGLPSEKIYQLKFFDYTIGELNYEKFESFLENHTGTDFAKRYQKRLANRPGIEVKSKPVVVVDLYKWLELCEISSFDIPETIQNQVNIYFAAASVQQFERFKNEFSKQQQFITAYFGVNYSVEDIARLGSTFVNVFYGFANNTKAGWVLPTFHSIAEIKFPDPRILQRVNSFLKQNSEALSINDGPFSRYLKIVSEILASGEKQMDSNNFSHAFIDFFVGMDFLLAPDTEKSKKLKNRISLLVYQFFNRSLVEQVEVLNKLYDQRSDYVHNGVSINKQDAIELRDITKVITGIVFNLHKKNSKNAANKYDDWIKLIDDHLEKFYVKGIEPTPKARIELGIYDLETVILHGAFAPKVGHDVSI